METALVAPNRSEAAPSLLGGEFIAPDDLAQELNVSPRTLHRWHTLRMGPPRVCIGRTILYRRAAVRAWLEGQEETKPRSRKASR